ncbi:MAG: hypothetical protein NC131_06435 [Roseburia sp.]|nr:hypothetical protein [Roseburia sp.]
MAKKEKTKKLSSEGSSIKEKLLARKKKLAEKGTSSAFIFPKNGTTRVRILSAGPDNEPALEVVRFYVNGHSVFSPATFEEPCPFMEEYKRLKDSKDEDDKKLAKKLVPSRRYVLGCIIFKDAKGQEMDYSGEPRLLMVPSSVYQDIIEYWLDEDEAGDMTDPKTGYDIKIERSGSGQFDTTYSVRACKPTKIDKALLKTVDLDEMVRSQIKSYDELEEELKDFLNNDTSSSDDDDDEAPAKKKVSKEKSSKKDKSSKKKRHGDI